jgi:hypothetical protein
MEKSIKSVTLKLSQDGVNYLQNGVYVKYFMDIMSELLVSFKYDEETNEPDLICGPDAYFNLYELAERWYMTPENVFAVLLELKENGLLCFSFANDEFDIEPEIISFISGDNLTFRGAAIGTEIFDYRFEKMEEADKEQILSYLAGLTKVVFSAEQLQTCSLAANNLEEL